MQDVDALVKEGVVDPVRLRALFSDVRSELFRYPAIDPSSLSAAEDRFAEADRA